MSGKQLVATLKELGYPGSDSLKPGALDWMFENEAVSPMLKWFCDNVNNSNLLSQSDADVYKSMCQTGEVILKDRQLDEALSNLNLSGDDSISEESLKCDLEQLESDLNHYKKQKERLTKKRDLLSNHLASSLHRQSKLSNVQSRAQQDYKKALEETHSANTHMNFTLERLNGCISELSGLYNHSSSSSKGADNLSTSLNASSLPCNISQSALPSQNSSLPMFLSQVPVQQYYNAEEAFTTQLTAYTKKQFFQGISEMASCGEDSRFEILEVSDPESLLVRGPTDNEHLQDCKDLARLHKLYTKSETDEVRAQCESRRLKGQLGCANALLDTLKTGTFCMENDQSKDRLEKLRGSLVLAQQDFIRLADQEVPRLIQECRDAKVMRVLTGDYNLKLVRQDYFTTNQDKVISQLILQRSRNEFFTMGLEVELRGHREIHHILTALHNLLRDHLSQWQARMSVMSDPLLTPARHERSAIDSRDKSTARIFQLLDESDAGEARQLFSTYSCLVENASALQQRHQALHKQLTASSTSGMDHVHKLESTVCRCEDLTYAGSSTRRGLPPLTPRSILENLLQLQEMTSRLEHSIIDVVKDLDQKKKLLKNDPLLVREKKLSTYFFTNPAKLHQILEELSTKLHAECHLDKSQQKS